MSLIPTYYQLQDENLALMKECNGLKADIKVLAEAIAELGIEAGIIDGNVPLTGPQILLVCDEIKKILRTE
jgi:hypothetical protein